MTHRTLEVALGRDLNGDFPRKLELVESLRDLLEFFSSFSQVLSKFLNERNFSSSRLQFVVDHHVYRRLEVVISLRRAP